MADDMTQVAQGVQQTQSSIGHMQSSASELASIAITLQQLIDRFKFKTQLNEAQSWVA